jgi:hypothetical protein
MHDVTNVNAVLTWNNSYGTNCASWLRPLAILDGRIVTFGIQGDF